MRARRWLRGGAFGGLAVVCVLLVLLGAGAVKPHSRASGRWGYILENGRLGIVRASKPMAAAYPAWQFGGARIMLGRKSDVWPNTTKAAITIGTATTSPNALWLPLAVPLGIVGAATAGLAFFARRVRVVGACGACGYDLAGLRGVPCPECGAVWPLARR